jgi:hypothetical protein
MNIIKSLIGICVLTAGFALNLLIFMGADMFDGTFVFPSIFLILLFFYERLALSRERSGPIQPLVCSIIACVFLMVTLTLAIIFEYDNIEHIALMMSFPFLINLVGSFFSLDYKIRKTYGR